MYYLIIIIFLFITNNVGAADLWTKYSIPDTINCITSYDDFIWMGTQNGIIKMNRNNGIIDKWFTSDKDSLAEKFINLIVSDKNGNIFAGSKDIINWWGGDYGGLSFFNGESWKIYKKDADGLAGNDIRGIKVDENNLVWIALCDAYFEGPQENRYFITRQVIQYYEDSKWQTKRIEFQSIFADGNWTAGIDSHVITSFDIADSGYFAYGHLVTGGYYARVTTSDNFENGVVVANDNGSWIGSQRIFDLKIEEINDNKKMVWVNGLFIDLNSQIAYANSDSLSNIYYKWNTVSVPIAGFSHTSSPMIIDKNHSKWFIDKDTSNKKFLIKYDDVNYIPFTCENWTPETEILSLYADDQGYIWVGTQSDGLFRFDAKNATIVQAAHEQPALFTLSSPYPNPFNAQTTISFDLNKQGKVNLSIYSLTGQKVRELAAGNYTAGKHTAVWDGKNEQGETVSSGLYLARMESGGMSKVVRMAMVK